MVRGGGVFPLLPSEGRGEQVALREGAWASRIEREDLRGICLSGMFSDRGGVVDVLLLILLAVREEAVEDDVFVGSIEDPEEELILELGLTGVAGVGVEAVGLGDALPLLGLREGILSVKDPSDSRRD